MASISPVITAAVSAFILWKRMTVLTAGTVLTLTGSFLSACHPKEKVLSV